MMQNQIIFLQILYNYNGFWRAGKIQKTHFSNKIKKNQLRNIVLYKLKMVDFRLIKYNRGFT